MKAPTGSVCTGGNQCQTGTCAQAQSDQRCSSVASCPSCQVVNNAGTACTAASASTDPKNECAPNAASCTGDLCNGSGGCQAQSVAVQCAGATCVGSTFTPARFCDGVNAGGCPASGASSCSPYVCAGSACGTMCTSAVDCINANYTCSGGFCRLGNGFACSTGAECVSGVCADGVCCNTTCTAQCKACDQVGSVGTCTNVPIQDPPRHGTCSACGLCNAIGVCCTFIQCSFPNGICVQ